MVRALVAAVLLGFPIPLLAEKEVPPSPKSLPFDTVFKGEKKFDRLMDLAVSEKWAAFPLGERTVRIGLALCGTPYKNYTLEIDDHVEAASVNMGAMDCWTFFEIALNSARLLRMKESDYQPRDLLALIELERYHGGVCTGSYLSRIHHLEDLFADNQSRGLVTDITRSLGGVRIYREVREMQVAWKSYRYLVNNPGLRPGMARLENRITDMPVYHIPRGKVAAIEPKLQSGDIIAITSRDDGGYTSHVGLAYRDAKGVLRFMHASSKSGEVLVDVRLSDYLAKSSSRAGIIVARPNEAPGALPPKPAPVIGVAAAR